MRFRKFIRGVAPAIAIAAAAGLAGCNSGKMSFNGKEGVPLSELDMSGEAPRHVMLLGPDSVIIHEGTAFAIDVEGSDEAREKVRFVLDDDELAVLRENGGWSGGDTATVRVTMPAPEQITIAGAGDMTLDAMAAKAEVSIAGSGRISAPAINVEKLEVGIAGSGKATIGGTAGKLEVSIAGSGDAQLGELTAESAEISIAGSGDVVFTSDGEVDVSIAGSGNVTVRGDATCTVSSMGSGRVRCERGTQDKAA